MFERDYTQVLDVTRRPEDREPIKVTPHVFQSQIPFLPDEPLMVPVALPVWDRHDITAWRQSYRDQRALEAAQTALTKPAPITAGRALKALLKLPSLWLAEVRRG